MEVGIQICQQYGIESLLQPIIDYVPTSDSPPPAPKHIVNAPGSRTKKVKEDSQATDASNAPSPASASGTRKTARQSARQSTKPRRSTVIDRSRELSSQASRTPTPSDDEDDFGSSVPSPRQSEPPTKRRRQEPAPTMQMPMQMQLQHHPPAMPQHYQQHPGMMPHPGIPMRPASQASMYMPMPQVPSGPDRYARLILDYFVSESPDVPDFLLRPPPDFDPNVTIDDDGHTALHWASAMGRLQVVKLLLAAGADIFRPNGAGQTPLMRAVMFTNNYDLRKFPELYDQLRRATLNIDHHDRSVFHHIVELALHKGKTAAARYYLETVLSRVKEFPGDMANVLNYHDDDGETCLTLAARAQSRSLVKLIIEAGGDPLIKNAHGKSAQDYVLEDERLRNGEQYAGASGAGASLVGQIQAIVSAAAAAQSQQLFQSQAAQQVTTRGIPQMSELLSSMASTYESELAEKEKDAAQASALLGNIQSELVESQTTLANLQRNLQAQSPTLEQLRDREHQLEKQLKERMAQRFRQGWAKYAADEEQRKAQFQMNGAGLPADMQALYAQPSSSPEEALQQSESEVKTLQEEKRHLVDQLVHKAATGQAPAVQGADGSQQSGSKIEQYRKLLALGTGLPMSEIDREVDGLMENLEEGLSGP